MIERLFSAGAHNSSEIEVSSDHTTFHDRSTIDSFKILVIFWFRPYSKSSHRNSIASEHLRNDIECERLRLQSPRVNGKLEQ